MDRSAMELTGRLTEYARLAEQVLAMRDNIENVTGTAHSADGLITAVVGGRGELRELELDPRVFRERNASALSARIVETVREAAAEAERAATRFAETLLPVNRTGADVDPVFDTVLHLLDTTAKEVR